MWYENVFSKSLIELIINIKFFQVPKLQYNASCDSLNICDNNLNFVCNNSICLCADTTQWNGISCGNY